MSNGLSIGKKIVSIFLLLDTLAVIAGSVIYSLVAFNIIKADVNDLEQAFGAVSITFLGGMLVMIGGFACLVLSIISTILSCVAQVRRPHALVIIPAVLLAAVSFFMIPLSSLSNAFSFALTFPSLLTSPLYLNFSQYFGICSGVFAIILLILAIVDIKKTSNGE